MPARFNLCHGSERVTCWTADGLSLDSDSAPRATIILKPSQKGTPIAVDLPDQSPYVIDSAREAGMRLKKEKSVHTVLSNL